MVLFALYPDYHGQLSGKQALIDYEIKCCLHESTALAACCHDIKLFKIISL